MSDVEPQVSVTSDFRFGRAALFVFLGLLILSGFLALAFLGMLPWKSSELTLAEKTQKSNDLITKNNAFGSLADHTRAATAWTNRRYALELAAQQIGQAQQLLKTFQARTQELEQSETGSRIAADPELVATYASLQDIPRPPAADLERDLELINRYRKLAAQAEGDSAIIVAPNQEFLDSCSDLGVSAQEALEAWTEVDTALTALIQRASRTTPGEQKLHTVLTQLREQRDAELLDAVHREREQVRVAAERQRVESERQAEATIQAAEDERQQALAQLNAAAATGRSTREKAIVAEAMEKLAAERAYAERFQRFKRALPEIKSLLSPMISTGRMQIGRNGWTAGEEGPVSWAALQKAKVLNLNQEGMINLGTLFGGPLNRNDRPRGGFPETMTSNEATIRRAQELLVEYGDILVEQGMLRP